MNKLLVSLVIFLKVSVLYGQSEFFHRIDISSEIKDSEKWNFDAEATWKHLYEEPAWRRFGLSATAKRKLGNWELLGGLSSYYTFDKEIDNYLEVRPWAGLALRTKIIERLDFKQQFKGEWRYFLFSDANADENYGRLRYKMGLDYILSENEETTKEWKLVGSIQWYFLKEPATRERFANSHEYELKLIHSFINGHEIGFGMVYEEFNRLFQPDNRSATTVLLVYRF